MKKQIITLGLLLVALFIGCDSKKNNSVTNNNTATIYHNGDIITMDGEKPVYVDALVENEGKIAFIGSYEDALENYGSDTQKINLNGKTLLPGFIDGHGHIYNTGMLGMAANILPAPDGPGTDFDSLVEAVKEWTETENGKFMTTKIGWIMGNGYDDSQLKEKTHPTREVLDKISTTEPVIVIHQSGHIACVNTKALEVIGYTKDSKEIEGGVIRRDKNGMPNGVLEEAAFFNALLPIIAANSDQELQLKSVEKGQEAYAKYGYTTAQDGRSTPDVTAAFKEAVAQNKFFIDVVAYPDIIWNKEAVTPEFYKEDRSYTNHYRIGGVKLTLDGSPQGKTAWLSKCYHVNPEGQEGCYTGYPIMPDEKAIEYVTTAFENKWQIMAHTNGDAAIDQFIKAIDAAIKTNGYEDHRSVMIHGQTLQKEQIPELTRLDIYPSLFPMHTFYWGDWHRESVLGEERAAYISPTRDVVDAGMTITSHHDAPVTFPNSLRVLDATVNRVTRSGFILGPDQRLTAYEGLKTLTEWAAIQHFEEDYKGTLAVGKLADFVILDKNPLKVDPLTINTIQVLETIKEGKMVYQKENMSGNWNQTAIEDDVQEALNFAIQQINPNAKLKEIISAKKQVVKGLNYDFRFTLDNGETWNALVYRDLDSNLKLNKKSKIALAGGWSDVSIENDVQEALNFAIQEINTNASLKKVISAKKQVVKGLNYDLKFMLNNGEIWSVLVYRDLDGNLSITEKAKTTMPGGWSDTEITDDVKAATNYVLSKMNNASALKEIVSAKSQVVKGINYKVTFSLENNTVWTATVNRDLDGKYAIIQEAKKQ
ncbi:amidohydrolase family protein [Polaribacter sp. MED152]|uniref:amidohydrolase family protein n=1 Tax=Polaribacter sp. MED152 TaxID=313598 RepID=UPI000068CAEB|nr:amidohydrolase family protein [Polaribacter sp. MED152]EAQ42446.1 metal-dependent amidohydrolase [Polaribacter sp. MED152]